VENPVEKLVHGQHAPYGPPIDMLHGPGWSHAARFVRVVFFDAAGEPADPDRKAPLFGLLARGLKCPPSVRARTPVDGPRINA
jgi:hypothetical protein